MKPYYEHGGIRIYHGDCREVLPQLERPHLVVADPPYGIGLRFGGTGCSTADPRCPVLGDDKPFDPTAFLGFPRCVLFGANHDAHRLPPARGWIVWDKVVRNDVNVATISDGEVAWTNFLPRLRIFRHLWNGGFRQSEAGQHVHPTQKPVALMRWILDLGSIEGDLVVEPFMGSGPLLQAALEMGRRAVGIELDERWCEVAARRLQQEVLPLFAPEPAAEPVQPALWAS